MPAAPPDPVAGREAVEAVWRIESARLIAALARFTGDIGLAEDLAQDALLAALQQWPATGTPPNPGGWLMTTAKNRAVDGFRREALHRRTVQGLGHQVYRQGEDPSVRPADEADAALDDPVGDDELRLLFAACHPELRREYRVALTLRCLAGLSTPQIARAFLVADSVVGQRVSRAKKTLRDKGIGLHMPEPADLPERLSSVLEVIYLIFNEGYSASSGEDWMRPELCHDALRLARRTAALVPGHAEAQGLLALLEFTQSRAAARHDAEGAPVLLQDQDRGRWDRLLIGRGFAALARAHRLGSVGPYVLQAAIAGCHAAAPSAQDTDWARIAGLYDTLERHQPTPVVTLNRAAAHGRAHGAAAGLAVLATLPAGSLDRYPQRHAVEGELLAWAGRRGEAGAAYRRAAELTANAAERRLLLRRAASTAPS
ncbi:RNA polymerase sigma factor [Allonocardiopsis opalescens]|uniref:RNA polymerase sigma factor (Sigma-70 family) n=1 Tax=Allonocardiopsis opalescens TaxID=1144618 RepID=A0A2T0PYM9_9ACTN|nr:sigma-70 family RNA polymerase sigma factor [Allonocardiopsis opalescens]PRX96634.1 RNA polymerase sigma factor (sigma-70 family) [Allonocardiopsis opalescens]